MIEKMHATSSNRVYLVRATPSPKFLASLGTSDILRTLGDILPDVCRINKQITSKRIL
jgi:hypothetical protein